MTGLEKIVKQIGDEARQSADEIIASAKAEAEKIAARAQADGRAQSAVIEAQGKLAVQNSLAASQSAAALSRRRAILETKQQLISDVISEAQKSVYALPDSEYFALILKMVGKFSLPQDGEIIFSPTDLKRLPFAFALKVKSAAKGSLSVSKETRELDGGFVLVYGGIEENCSIEALFYAAREELQDKAQQILFS